MKTPIIVMGAAGRMGTTVTRLVREDPSLALAGRVDLASRLDELAPVEECTDSDDVRVVLDHAGKAVIIDFTAPAYSVATAKIAADKGAAQVIGTTGFSELELAELKHCAAKTPIFWSPNMSVGVNVLLKILPELARLLGEDYDMEMVEIHHNKKKDSPSGTALRLAEAMVAARGWDLNDTARCQREGLVGERPHKEMGLLAVRGGDVVGVHTAYFLGHGERIEVTHHAHSRENFAQGALRAAKWLAGRKAGKLYSMEDML
ncbi:MAG: 4-hydroxy-tetrahydrodipicolinate reductase [Deltaproteobacteria bacterium]|nr:4-hydroxy-tetrahydrodipicolinate reductase [Deltaproteobacteria bacterium]